ncbi:NADPH-dependent FMN reductase [Mycolicibacterium brumae]|uniref:NADPH-dependent oxidoreductase n=1 Tax=Mycolicibacterium brumae TaxID=85968 RepID=A0A2G5P9K4_9MYCO|nr:NAD(P)H-dependent oxidoreductase [Mycolicibacterium brumae]MCV7194186.1 NAD(P)H-dependent oxidoreductase [Mycolicibacterium brumae]PIB74683.1 NADPH-dependent oxidoreductase [Mycolicibacterium brumae]RWA17665.1 hypothetical protein MBRU_18770 [Mycolicibacterium brumae DSM 44177]UWW08070.1 NAD(P)H-dependent oxidoreductase [Mycolicibacterium brumae]
MRIGIIIGSIRDGRLGAGVAEWVAAQAASRDEAEFVVIDLKSFEVPLLTTAVIPATANRQYESPQVRRWSEAIDGCDAFVFVTPEYNHGVPGAFKNAIDSLASEWQGKAVAFVSYGADGGVRAVEQWRQIVVNFYMVDVRAQLALSLFTDFADGGFAPQERRVKELDNVLNQLITMAGKLS